MRGGNGSKQARSGAPARNLQARFYTAVAVEAATPVDLRILLDGRPIRTPAKAQFAVPTQALAEAVAEEWRAQVAVIDPVSMPLTALCNTAIDGIRGREAQIRAEIAGYGASDLVCYRAETPDELVRRQAQAWDGVLAWARDTLGVRLATSSGVMPVRQPDEAVTAVARALEAYDAFGLCALHLMTALMGSALLALAHVHDRLTVAEAWAAAHVDEDWQIAKWGEDAEAAARRARRWGEMEAASRLLSLLRRPGPG
jgi:chaperone required for assembly of F1-ATPase